MTESERRLLLVHAHPDDETINNGATMARYAAEGAHVTLITCTRGEQGEVIPAHLAHLAASAKGGLGPHRERELAAAMRALGVSDHRFLGAPARTYVDSGMAYDDAGAVVPSPDPPPGAFALVEVEEPAEVLAAQIRQLRPQVVVTYEPGGDYGHPDHVQAHLVTMRAVELAAPDWNVPKVYWAVLPQSLVRAALRALSAASGPDYTGLDPHGPLPSMVIDDGLVTTTIDAMAFTPDKVKALRAHETQVRVSDDGAFFALSNGVRQPIMGLEFYRLVRGARAGALDELGRESDLFAGVA